MAAEVPSGIHYEVSGQQLPQTLGIWRLTHSGRVHFCVEDRVLDYKMVLSQAYLVKTSALLSFLLENEGWTQLQRLLV